MRFYSSEIKPNVGNEENICHAIREQTFGVLFIANTKIYISFFKEHIYVKIISKSPSLRSCVFYQQVREERFSPLSTVFKLRGIIP